MRKSQSGLKNKVIHGVSWKFAENIGIQGIHFIVQIVIARMLFPEDYAVIALISVFIAVANSFVESGLGTALIQKKDADQIDCSSVFYVNMLLAALLYYLLFISAPKISAFYSLDILTTVIRVQAISLFLGALNGVQIAILSQRMEFKKSFFAHAVGTISFGIVGISLAYYGFGVWALVFSKLTSSAAITIVLWKTVAWRPSLLFSTDSVRTLFNYGWKILTAGLIDTLYINLRKLIIGKTFDKKILGYYDRGDHLPNMLICSINNSVQAVMFPTFALLQDDREQLKAIMRRSIITSSFIVFPAMVGLAIVAERVVIILLTEKWIGCVPFLQLACITYAFFPIHTTNLQVTKAVGRSDIFLRIEIIKKILELVIIFVSLPFGVYALVGSNAFFSIVSVFINAWPNKKIINYSIKEQWNDIAPSLMLSLCMGAIVYSIQWIGLPVWSTFLVQILSGVVVYTLGAWIFKFECFHYILKTVRDMLRRK